MDYSKLLNDHGMYLYKDDNFNTIVVNLSWIAEQGNRENAMYDLLCDYLLDANKTYDTRDSIKNKSKYLYGLDLQIDIRNLGKQRVLTYCIDMIAPSVIKDDYSEEAFKFANELLMNPSFDKEEVFERYKRTRINSLRNAYSNPSRIARDLYFQKVLPAKGEEYEFSTDIDYIEKLYNSISLKDIKELYERTVNNDKFYSGLVFGNITDKEFENFRRIFTFDSDKGELEYRKPRKIVPGTIIIPSSFANESIVYQTFSIDKFDNGSRELLKDIFDGSSDLCLKVLRGKYDLVYESFVQLLFFENIMYIKSKIDKSKFNQLIDATDEMLGIVQNEKTLKPLLDRSKDVFKKDVSTIGEDRDEIIRELSNKIRNLYDGYDVLDFAEKVDDVKEEDITKLTKSLKRRSIFMYRGDAK